MRQRSTRSIRISSRGLKLASHCLRGRASSEVVVCCCHVLCSLVCRTRFADRIFDAPQHLLHSNIASLLPRLDCACPRKHGEERVCFRPVPIMRRKDTSRVA